MVTTEDPALAVSCSIEGCDRVKVARGWCHRHYYRWRRTGDPLKTFCPGREQTVDERYWSKVSGDDIDNCWSWTAYRTSRGYGRFWDGTTMISAHNYSYEALIGPVPLGLELDHLCRNTSCVNPWHLEPVTHWVNMERSANILLANAAKTHCSRDHEYTVENTYITTAGGRQCRTCDLARKRVTR